MRVDLSNEAACQTHSSQKKFGLCDDPPPANNPAYIDEQNGGKWIAVVINERRRRVTFTAIDKCIPIRLKSGKDSKRCDGILTFDRTIIFVELKERAATGNAWVEYGEKQLRATISAYDYNDLVDDTYRVKRAYIANNEHPKFKSSQQNRMDKFARDTGYVIRVQARIEL
jgi:hypothetical protein